MTCEFLTPHLSTRRVRFAATVASAAGILRSGGPESEIALPDGTTITAVDFDTLVATAKRHDGLVAPEIQSRIDGILAIDAERKLAAMKVLSPDDDPVWRKTAAFGAMGIAFCLTLIAVQGFWGDTERRAAATLAQGEQAQFVEASE